MVQRSPVPIASHQVPLPAIPIPPGTDHEAVSARLIQRLASLQPADLCNDVYWRDLLALTGTFRTFHPSHKVAETWIRLSYEHTACDFAPVLDGTRIERNVIRAKFTFKTRSPDFRPACCSGFMSIVLSEHGDWKIWVLSTMIEHVEGWPDPDLLLETESTSKPACRDQNLPATSTIDDQNSSSIPGNQVDVDCVVVDTGHSGLCILGRLRVLGVSAIGIERNTRIGDSWTNRYKTLKLHTPKSLSQLPFGRWFREDQPYYLSAQQVASAYRDYADACHLNIWCSSDVVAAFWDQLSRTWTVQLIATGEKRKITTRHLIFAIGGTGQQPKAPIYLNREGYTGTTKHSAEWSSARGWSGKKGLVIGAGTTGHDVAKDMVQCGLTEVTMIQRSRTAYFLEEYFRAIFDPTYHESSNIGQADRALYPMPYPVSRAQSLAGMRNLAAPHSAWFDELERAGLHVDRCPDITRHFYEVQGGHYVDDRTASKMIVDGQIRIISNALPKAFTKDGLRMTDGSIVEADVIVFCTGFHGNMRTRVADIVGSEIADQLEDYWSFDAEGELRGNWRPLGHPAIWYAGGTMSTSRFYSRFLALQIKADLDDVPFVPYEEDIVNQNGS